jgi:serine/threonine-protein kinase
VPFHGETQVSVAMKHVREDLPDIQLRRPEVSSALAAVLDRATSKDLGHRYADDRELIADLEDVLAIETARSGQATGEATAVLRTLSPSAQRRLPARVVHPMRILLVLALLGAAVAVALVLLSTRTERGTRQRPVTKAPPGLETVSLAQGAARDFDPPPGDGVEHRDEVRNVLDDDPGTTWSTESYQGATLNNKPGVGIYVDAKPGVAARAIDIRTTTPAWSGKVFVARSGQGPPKTLDGWQDLGTISSAKKRTRVSLDTAGNRFRYYLVWITKLPPKTERVEISEIVLYR